MPQLVITKNYQDGTTLTETQLDTALTDVETFVNTTKLDSDNIQDGGLDADTLASNAVTEAKINASAVTTGKIADAAVTQAKLAARSTGASVGAGGVAISATSTGPSGSTTNLTVTITTTGRPVFVGMVPDGSSSASWIKITSSSTAFPAAFLYVNRGATAIATSKIESEHDTAATNGVGVPPGVVFCIDTAAAGTYTYTVTHANGSGTTTHFNYCKLVAYEL